MAEFTQLVPPLKDVIAYVRVPANFSMRRKFETSIPSIGKLKRTMYKKFDTLKRVVCADSVNVSFNGEKGKKSLKRLNA